MKGACQILSILDIKKQALKYLIFSIFLVIFATVYEQFSHGVYSNYLMYAFLIPLIFGFGTCIVIKKHPSKLSNTLYNLGLITLTLGSILKGVLDIYGTTNVLIFTYLIIGIPLTLGGIIIYIIKMIQVK